MEYRLGTEIFKNLPDTRTLYIHLAEFSSRIEVLLVSSRQIVYDNNKMAFSNKPINKITPNESRSPGYKNFHIRFTKRPNKGNESGASANKSRNAGMRILIYTPKLSINKLIMKSKLQA